MGHATLFTANLICIGMLLIALVFIVWAYNERWNLFRVSLILTVALSLFSAGCIWMQQNIEKSEAKYRTNFHWISASTSTVVSSDLMFFRNVSYEEPILYIDGDGDIFLHGKWIGYDKNLKSGKFYLTERYHP